MSFFLMLEDWNLGWSMVMIVCYVDVGEHSWCRKPPVQLQVVPGWGKWPEPQGLGTSIDPSPDKGQGALVLPWGALALRGSAESKCHLGMAAQCVGVSPWRQQFQLLSCPAPQLNDLKEPGIWGLFYGTPGVGLVRETCLCV